MQIGCCPHPIDGEVWCHVFWRCMPIIGFLITEKNRRTNEVWQKTLCEQESNLGIKIAKNRIEYAKCQIVGAFPIIITAIALLALGIASVSAAIFLAIGAVVLLYAAGRIGKACYDVYCSGTSGIAAQELQQISSQHNSEISLPTQNGIHNASNGTIDVATKP